MEEVRGQGRAAWRKEYQIRDADEVTPVVSSKQMRALSVLGGWALKAELALGTER